MKKLILIDGNSMLFRAYYATAYAGGVTMTTKEGIPTNAVYALANIMTKIINEHKPDYALVAFDTGTPTFRHLKYPEYKAGRKETPQELLDQFSIAKELLRNMGIFTYEKPGFEADDILGSMSKIGSANGLEVEIYSGDRDLLQLISPTVTVCLTKKGVSDLKVMSEEALYEELGIKPTQITDLKGLMGDKSDNIPGVAGVGEKTAIKLLKEYGCVETIVDAEISGKLGEKIKASKEIALLSKELATINVDLPLDFELEQTLYKGANAESLYAFYSKYEMFSLLKKINYFTVNENKVVNEESETQEEVKQTNSNELDYEYVEKVPQEFLKSHLSIAVEVVGGNYHVNKVYGLALCNGFKTYVIRIDNAVNDKDLLDYLKDGSYEKYGFDIKKILIALNRHNVEINNLCYDALLATYLLEPSLKEEPAIIFNYYGISLPLLSNVYAKGQDLEANIIKYLALLASSIYQVKEESLKLLKEHDMLDLYNDIELPVCFVLAKMEKNGVKLDLDLLKKKSEQVQDKLNKLTEEIYALAGEEYNINSPSQTAHILFDVLALPANKKRSTSADELSLLVKFHPIVGKILEYRRYMKLQSTYLQALPTYVLEDGKIHTIYNQALTQTGRLSSREPNLQNITIRDEESKEVRKAFIASEDGWYILSFDYSQIELRVLAHMANEQAMIKAFNDGVDIHTLTAKNLYGVEANQVDSTMRRHAKVINFGIIYGMSDWGLADDLGIGVKQASQFKEKYFASYPGIQDYFKKTLNDANESLVVKTLFNRARKVNELKDRNFNIREFGKRVVMNTPIQGTAADIIKLAMVKVDELLEKNNFKTRMLLQVHDELVFEVPIEELMVIIPLIEKTMEEVVDFQVRLKVEYNYGYDWSK